MTYSPSMKTAFGIRGFDPGAALVLFAHACVWQQSNLGIKDSTQHDRFVIREQVPGQDAGVILTAEIHA
jgi:hypothetical protein